MGDKNPTKAARIHVDERCMSEMDTLQRGTQSTILIKKSGLYALIL